MKILLLAFAMSATCLAQQNDCDLHTVTDTAPAFYPPIARAAHVTGTIIMIATFKPNGNVEGVKVLSGPKMLEQPTIEYVRGWRANEYGSIRNCPVVVNYVLDKSGTENNQHDRIDSQHVNVYGKTVCLCDPPAELGKRKKRFLFF
jgi:hypothetical protein